MTIHPIKTVYSQFELIAEAQTAHVEFDYGGTPLADEGDAETIQGLVGSEAYYYGRQGTIEAVRLVEGETPWAGPPAPRPVYRVLWRPA